MHRTPLTLAAALLALAAGAPPAVAEAISPQHAARLAQARADSADTPTRPACATHLEGGPGAVRHVQRDGAVPVYVECTGAPAAKLVVTDRPDHGGLDTYVNGGLLVYEPAPGYTGPDRFSYVGRNEVGDSEVVTVKLEVGGDHGTDGAPSNAVACFEDPSGGASIRVRENETGTTELPCWDGDDDFTATVSAQGAHGTATVQQHTEAYEGGTYRWWTSTYDPSSTVPEDGVLQDTFTVAVADGDGGTGTVVVHVDIVPSSSNTDPFCSSGPVEGGPAVVEPGETGATGVRCFDADGDALAFSFAGAPGFGAEGGLVVHTAPAGAAEGERTASFVVDDGHGGTAAGTVTVLVEEHADPGCTDRAVSTGKDAAVQFSVSCKDPDGDDVHVSFGPLAETGEHHLGQIARHGDLDVLFGEGGVDLTYAPDRGFTGRDGFRAYASDAFDHQQAGAVVEIVVGAVAAPQPAQQQQPQQQQPVGPTPAQAAAAINAAGEKLVGQAAATLVKALATGAKAVDPSSGELSLGTVGAAQLPHGGTVGIGVFAEPKALRGAARKRARKPVSLGRSVVVVAKGQSKAIKVRLGKRGRGVLQRKRRLAVTVQLTLTDALSGQTTTVTKQVVLKARKAKGRKRR